MSKVKHHLVLAALIGAAYAAPSYSASSTASMAADSASTSVGSVSDSFKGSSNSSTTKTAAAGDYQIVQLALAADRPGMVVIQLQALAKQGPEGELVLYLPETVAQRNRLAQGDVVTAKARPYGTEFSDTRTSTAFFLVLNDDAFQDLKTNAVAL